MKRALVIVALRRARSSVASAVGLSGELVGHAHTAAHLIRAEAPLYSPPSATLVVYEQIRALAAKDRRFSSEDAGRPRSHGLGRRHRAQAAPPTRTKLISPELERPQRQLGSARTRDGLLTYLVPAKAGVIERRLRLVRVAPSAPCASWSRSSSVSGRSRSEPDEKCDAAATSWFCTPPSRATRRARSISVPAAPAG